jgi:hypothetical protein
MPRRLIYISLAAPLVVLAAMLLGACGSSSNTASTRPATTTDTVTVSQPASGADATTGTSTATSTTPAAISTATGTTSTASAGGDACVAADLTPSFLGGNGATGTVVLTFALTNRSDQSCHTYGWPGVEFLGSGGQALATNAKRTTSDALGTTAPVVLTLAPGKEASFRIITADQGTGAGTAGCVSASELQIIAPDDTATMKVALTNGPVTACGNTTVSPLLAGTTAQPGS